VSVRQLTCIVCPRGCEITVTTRDGEVVSVTGNLCNRGFEYAVAEVLNPKRVVMTVVRCRGGDLPVVPVRTTKPVPKDKVPELVRYLSRIRLEAPVLMGEIVARNVLGLDVDVIATRPCKRV